MKGWSFFLEGIKDACQDLLTDEIGGTQRERIAGNLRVAEDWPDDDPHTKGYRYALGAIDLYLDSADGDTAHDG